MKKLILLLLFLIIKLTYAEMPSLIGRAEFNSEAYRDNIYNYLIENSTKCINLKEIEKYGVSPTSTTYGLELMLHFSKMNESFRNKVKDKIKQVKNDDRTTHMKIGIYMSHNDGIPGRCQLDFIGELITK